ncbi:MAG: hypothetical protein JWQ83_203 [Lacunisphaera sp.]|nr:hypothetical protein [Lacunisphaera sp.]
MSFFLTVFTAALLLSTACVGIGALLAKTATPAAMMVRRWALFFFLCALVWFARFSASSFAPAIWLFVVVGVGGAISRIPWTRLLLFAAGTALIAAVFAIPFFRYPGLVAYAHAGTDQWGYIGVSNWLVTHSVDDLPVLGEKMSLNWVWHILATKERPLIFISLATIAGAGGFTTVLAYYVLPVALMSGVFGCLCLTPGSFGFRNPLVNAGLALCVAMQPLVLWHFQLQFLGGTISALVIMMIVISLLHTSDEPVADWRFPAYACWLCILGAGLYSIKVAIPPLALTLALTGYRFWQKARRAGQWELPENLRSQRSECLVVLGVAAVTLLLIARLSPETLGSPYNGGMAGHRWAQIASVFGGGDLLPWYFVDGSLGWMDPVTHHPAGSNWAIVILGAAIVWMGVLASRAWRFRRDAGLALTFVIFAGVLYVAAPPRGTHWSVSRSLPIFGASLVVAMAAAARGEKSRWIQVATVGLCLLPLLRGAPRLCTFFLEPNNRFADGQWDQLPAGNAWDALAYVNYYDDSRRLDWSGAPDMFRAMTYFLPDELRPHLVDGRPMPPR